MLAALLRRELAVHRLVEIVLSARTGPVWAGGISEARQVAGIHAALLHRQRNIPRSVPWLVAVARAPRHSVSGADVRCVRLEPAVARVRWVGPGTAVGARNRLFVAAFLGGELAGPPGAVRMLRPPWLVVVIAASWNESGRTTGAVGESRRVAGGDAAVACVALAVGACVPVMLSAPDGSIRASRRVEP